MQSSLTQASRCANSQVSASNDGVAGDPNSPESNCSYLALILSIKELYSLCASCTVIKKTGLGMIAGKTHSQEERLFVFEKPSILRV